jgi:hypothetical protein
MMPMAEPKLNAETSLQPELSAYSARLACVT